MSWLTETLYKMTVLHWHVKVREYVSESWERTHIVTERERGQSERRLWPTASGHAWRKIVFSCSQPRIYSTRTLLSRSPKAYRVHTRLSSRWLWL